VVTSAVLSIARLVLIRREISTARETVPNRILVRIIGTVLIHLKAFIQ
jgi:hypothetical protein